MTPAISPSTTPISAAATGVRRNCPAIIAPPKAISASHRREAEAERKHGAEPRAAPPPDGKKQRREEGRRGKGEGPDAGLHDLDIGKRKEHAGAERRGGDRHPHHHQPRQHLVPRIDQAQHVVGDAAGEGEEMGGGGGKRDRHACCGHQHGADVRQSRRHRQRQHDTVARDEEL